MDMLPGRYCMGTTPGSVSIVRACDATASAETPMKSTPIIQLLAVMPSQGWSISKMTT